MGVKKKKGKTRLDKYYQMAKEQGYRARSAFKLVQLNKKYNFLNTARVVLDLCAAPGGWMQVAGKVTGSGGQVVGVDLVPIRPVPHCQSLVGDITTPKCRSDLKNLLVDKADVVLHDGSPNVGAAWLQDAYAQSELVLASLKLAIEFLKAGGWFITKVFRSNDYNSLLWVFNQLFKNVEATKPAASRHTSAEIYVVCKGYLDPEKIDPKLLDARYVFKELEQPSKPQDIFSQKKLGKRQKAEGYDDNISITMFKKISVAEFIKSDDPATMLAQYNQFVFDEDSLKYKNLKETTPEILALCEDLKLLNKVDFKNLLKWRLKAIKRTQSNKKKGGEKGGGEEGEEEEGEEEGEEEEEEEMTVEERDEQLTKELNEKVVQMKKQEKKREKKLRERIKKKAKATSLGMIIPGDQVQSDDMELFKLETIKNSSALENATEVAVDDLPEEEEEEQNKQKVVEFEDDDQQREDYDKSLEKYLDTLYEQYVETKATKAERVKLKKKKAQQENAKIKEEDTLDGEEQDEEEEMEIDPEDAFSEDEEITNPLLIKESKTVPSSKRAAMWFSQFEDLDDDEDEVAPQERETSKPAEKKQRLTENGASKKIITGKGSKEEVEEEDESDDDEDQPFEEVPRQQVKYSSDSDSSELDEDEKIEALALGTMMVRDREKKKELIASMFNKRIFNDQRYLPKWFSEDEQKHNKPHIPMTKEIMNEIKREQKAIDARPVKKIAEAKARKKMKAAKKFAKAKAQAAAIADSTEMTPGEKTRAIDKLYKTAMKKDRSGKKTYIVNKKSGGKRLEGGGKGGRIKLVDARMRKDTRNTKLKEKGGKKRKRR